MQAAFRGRPSRGCNKCRQRKIKCDEAQPSCDRCIKGGFECVYRDEFDLLLRNQTSETAVKAQRKWRSRAKKSEDPTTTSISSPSSSSGSESPRSTKALRSTGDITPSLNLDQSIYDLAAKRFLFDFVIPDGPGVPKTGFATFVPDLLEDMQPGTCMYHSFRATSLANFAARSKSSQAADMASKEYGLTIRLLGPFVTSPGSVSPLQTLSAVTLLSLYELLATPFLTHGGSWQAHVNGSVAILNSLYTQGAQELETLSELFIHIITQMLINRMTFGRWPSIPLSTVDVFIRPKTMGSQIITMLYKSAEAIAAWRDAEMDVNNQAAVLPAALKVVATCEAIDMEMEQWLAERAPIWEEEIKTCNPELLPSWLQDLYRQPGAPPKMRLSSNLLIAQRYTLMRSTRIQMYAHVLNALDVLIASAPTDEELALWFETQNRFETRAMALIDEVLSAICGHLTLPIRGKPPQKGIEDVPSMRVMMLLWPLYRSALMLWRRESLQQLDTQGRRFWIRSTMCWIRDDLGVKKCEAFVDNVDGKFGLTYC